MRAKSETPESTSSNFTNSASQLSTPASSQSLSSTISQNSPAIKVDDEEEEKPEIKQEHEIPNLRAEQNQGSSAQNERIGNEVRVSVQNDQDENFEEEKPLIKEEQDQQEDKTEGSGSVTASTSQPRRSLRRRRVEERASEVVEKKPKVEDESDPADPYQDDGGELNVSVSEKVKRN